MQGYTTPGNCAKYLVNVCTRSPPCSTETRHPSSTWSPRRTFRRWRCCVIIDVLNADDASRSTSLHQKCLLCINNGQPKRPMSLSIRECKWADKKCTWPTAGVKTPLLSSVFTLRVWEAADGVQIGYRSRLVVLNPPTQCARCTVKWAQPAQFLAHKPVLFRWSGFV